MKDQFDPDPDEEFYNTDEDHYLRNYNDGAEASETGEDLYYDLPPEIRQNEALIEEPLKLNPQEKGGNVAEDIQREIRNIISEIEEKSADGCYIYRGEPNKCYGEVSSSLRRQLKKQMKGVRNFDVEEEIEIVQAEDLALAKGYTHMTNDFDILTLLQHFGGATNLIDFTTDYRIALFFACEKVFAKDGRVILLKRTEEIDERYSIKGPRQLQGRPEVQKSIFVRSPKGFIEPHEIKIIGIQKNLKFHLLKHLQRHENISPVTIYNDLFGFIKFQHGFRASFAEVHRHLWNHNRDSGTLSEKMDRNFAHVIPLFSAFARLSNYRGMAYEQKGDWETAMTEYDKAIEDNPDYIDALLNRARLHKLRGDDALSAADLARVLELHRPDLNT